MIDNTWRATTGDDFLVAAVIGTCYDRRRQLLIPLGRDAGTTCTRGYHRDDIFLRQPSSAWLRPVTTIAATGREGCWEDMHNKLQPTATFFAATVVGACYGRQ